MKNRYFALIILSSLLLLFSSLNAIEFQKGNNVHLSNIHTIDDDLYSWGENVTIDGKVEGDLTVGGYVVRVNGDILNSANIFGSKCVVNGNINGSLRMFAQKAEIDGIVNRSVLIFANEIEIEEKAIISKDVVVGGETVIIDGSVKGNVKIYGNRVVLTGNFDSDVYIKAEKIDILPPAIISGDLHYVSKDEANIDVPSGAVVLGETVWDLPDDNEANKSESLLSSFMIESSQMFAAFLFGLILFLVGRNYISESVYQIKKKPFVSLGSGLLTFLVFIFSLVILLTSLILLLVGGVLVSEDHTVFGAVMLALSTLLLPITSFATVAGGLLFYAGKIIVSIIVGLFVMRRLDSQKLDFKAIHLFIGLIITTIITAIPYLGELIYFLIAFSGSGAIILGIKYCRRGLNNISKDSDTVGAD